MTDKYQRQGSFDSQASHNSSDGNAYTNQVQKVKQTKISNEERARKETYNVEDADQYADNEILDEIKRQIGTEMGQLTTIRAKFSNKVNQFQTQLDQHIKSMAKKQKNLRGESNKTANQSAFNPILEKEDDFQNESKDIMEQIKEIQLLISRHKKTVIVGQGSTEIRLKQQDEDRLYKSLKQQQDVFQNDMKKFLSSNQTYNDLKDGKIDNQSLLQMQYGQNSRFKAMQYDGDGQDPEKQSASRPAYQQNQSMMTKEDKLKSQQVKAFYAEMNQREEMAKENKQAMTTFNDIMNDLNQMSGDMNVQLNKQQVDIDNADQNLEEATGNMTDAQIELLKKRASLMKNVKRMSACFICLLIFFIILFTSAF